MRSRQPASAWLVEARGEIFTVPAEKGDVRNLSNSSGSAERDPAWSPDGKWISYFSDRSGEYKLVIESQDGLTPPREIALQHPTHYYTPSWSPDSKKLLYTDTNLKVWVLDIASGKAKIVGERSVDGAGANPQPRVAPDSKWVAYSSRLKSLYHAIFVSNVETGESQPGHRRRSPTPSGPPGTRAANICGSSLPPISV